MLCTCFPAASACVTHCARWSMNADSGDMQIHWFSIINSCVTVLLLTGFLATILMRVLKKDFVKYTRDDEGERHHVSSVPAAAKASIIYAMMSVPATV